MKPINHNVKIQRQGAAECLQTATMAILDFYDTPVTLEQVINDVPLSMDGNVKLGTSIGHMGAYLQTLGFQCRAHIFDTVWFDRSWRDKSSAKIVELLEQRDGTKLAKHSFVKYYHQVLYEGWKMMVEQGGDLVIADLTSKLLHQELEKGPFLAIVSAAYLNDEERIRYDSEQDRCVSDAIGGQSGTHALACCGYRDGQFQVADPNHTENDGLRWIDSEKFLVSIMAAQVESDNMIISVQKNS